MSHEKKNKWSANVNETSRSKDIPEGLFKRPAKEIAQELKKIVEQHAKPGHSAYESAMSMLDFYINRAGSNLNSEDRTRLEQAKNELRTLFGK